jgi:hypothetical protein
MSDWDLRVRSLGVTVGVHFSAVGSWMGGFFRYSVQFHIEVKLRFVVLETFLDRFSVAFAIYMGAA